MLPFQSPTGSLRLLGFIILFVSYPSFLYPLRGSYRDTGRADPGVAALTALPWPNQMAFITIRYPSFLIIAQEKYWLHTETWHSLLASWIATAGFFDPGAGLRGKSFDLHYPDCLAHLLAATALRVVVAWTNRSRRRTAESRRSTGYVTAIRSAATAQGCNPAGC